MNPTKSNAIPRFLGPGLGRGLAAGWPAARGHLVRAAEIRRMPGNVIESRRMGITPQGWGFGFFIVWGLRNVLTLGVIDNGNQTEEESYQRFPRPAGRRHHHFRRNP